MKRNIAHFLLYSYIPAFEGSIRGKLLSPSIAKTTFLLVVVVLLGLSGHFEDENDDEHDVRSTNLTLCEVWQQYSSDAWDTGIWRETCIFIADATIRAKEQSGKV